MLDSFSQLAFPVQALIATLFTWALTSLGACVVFFMRQPNRNVMDAMLGLAGGVMVAAAFWSLLSPSIDMSASLGMNPWLTALIGFMGGSLRKVWPWKGPDELRNVLPEEFDAGVMAAIGLAVFGFALVIVLETIAGELEKKRSGGAQ